MNELDLLNRRTFLGRSVTGIGTMALAHLLSPPAAQAIPAPSAPHGVIHPLHVPARAKRMIHLYMAGGPSHFETLDPKPKLAAMDGQPMPASFTAGQQLAQLQGEPLICLAPQHSFARWGESGQEISTILPHIGGVADDICIVRSLVTEQINHDPAHTFMNTGSGVPGRPSMGSWLLYGLGNACDDLPGYVVLVSVGGGQTQPIAARQWHSGFLPGHLQGVRFRSQGDPVLYIANPPGVDRLRQRSVIDATAELNRLGNRQFEDPELETRIAQFELAFRMQASVPDLINVSDEPQHVLDMYGATPGDGSFASNCLLARRLAERGVRFVQIYHRGWDHHSRVKSGTAYTASLCDQASAALLEDLKQRGMLDETLVVWGGEFGRTPMSQGGSGRDHHIRAFSIWLAGGGIRPGISYGQTDDLGYGVAQDKVHVHDLHATILNQFGIDHTKLTYHFQGRDFRLTDVHGRVVSEILAS